MYIFREKLCKANVIYGLNDGPGYLHCNPCIVTNIEYLITSWCHTDVTRDGGLSHWLTWGSDGVVPVQQPGHHGGHGPQEDQGDEQPGPGHGAPLLGHRGVTHVDVALNCQGWAGKYSENAVKGFWFYVNQK